MRAPTSLIVFLALLPMGCSEADAVADGDQPTAQGQSVVFGLLSDLEPGAGLDRLRLVLRERGTVVRDEVLRADAGELAFPLEVRTSPLPLGTEVDLLLEAYAPGASSPTVERRAASTVPGKYDTLFVVRIEEECVPGAPVLDELVGPACEEGTTCVGAACVDPFIGYAGLDGYQPNWAETTQLCGAPGSAPRAELGMGDEGVYTPLESEVIFVQGGLQGGFHMYAGVRVQGISGGKAFTRLTVDNLEGRVSFTTRLNTFDPLEDGRCAAVDVLQLLPLEPDPNLTPQEKIARIAGKAFHFDVQVIDRLGRLACDSRTVTVSEDVYIAD